MVAYLGWEQEYFLVDEGLYAARPDLLMTGRTLMEVTPKYALLSTHAGRKTFICNALALGIPAPVVMKWTRPKRSLWVRKPCRASVAVHLPEF